jgi:23S rRNA (guanosine2251-2'-O)-methyltransferase
MSLQDEAPLFGRHPVLELLRAESRRVEEIAILAQGRGPALHDLLALAKRAGVKVSFRTREQLTAMAGTPHHQGVVARVAGASYADLDALLTVPGERAEPAFLLALDQIQDPRNLGAILRSAEATGVHGVIVTKHHSVGLTPAAAKSAMGALEWLRVARVTNLAQALETLKKDGIWVVGSVVRGGRSPWETDLSGPVCLVLGGEGEGLRPLVARACDLLLTLPMKGRLGSVNVSAAAAVLCYEVIRQRRAARTTADPRTKESLDGEIARK